MSGTPIASLGLRTQIINALAADGVLTVERLALMSDRDLLRLPGISKVSLRQIRSVVPPSAPIERPFPISGMTLRDWFAGQALAALIGSGEIPFRSDFDVFVNDTATMAYGYAEAMLAERAK